MDAKAVTFTVTIIKISRPGEYEISFLCGWMVGQKLIEIYTNIRFVLTTVELYLVFTLLL